MHDLIQLLKGLGYENEYFEKTNFKSASAIFYKSDKLKCLESDRYYFDENESQFFMHCLFTLK